MTRFALAIAATLALTLSAGEQSSGRALGNPQAPIRIDLFSDFQCPACKVLHEQTISPLITNYVNAGKVYLVQREFPLPMHNHAREAAYVACAAERIGRYHVVADQLFRTQTQWMVSGDVVGSACSVLGPEEAKKLRALAIAPEIAKELDEEIRAGQSEKLNGTPTMVVTKMVRRFPVSGPVTYEVLSRFIDSLLK